MYVSVRVSGLQCLALVAFRFISAGPNCFVPRGPFASFCEAEGRETMFELFLHFVWKLTNK